MKVLIGTLDDVGIVGHKEPEREEYIGDCLVE
jgi:hypothetical protein